MNIQHTGHAGKTKIIFATDGACTFCGTRHASGWVVVGDIKAQFKTKTINIEISACRDCYTKEANKEERVAPSNPLSLVPCHSSLSKEAA